jgi:hypothetical protein
MNRAETTRKRAMQCMNCERLGACGLEKSLARYFDEDPTNCSEFIRRELKPWILDTTPKSVPI